MYDVARACIHVMLAAYSNIKSAPPPLADEGRKKPYKYAPHLMDLTEQGQSLLEEVEYTFTTTGAHDAQSERLSRLQQTAASAAAAT
jgi:hypothetical protein